MKSFKKILRPVAFTLIFLVLCSICEFVLLQFEGNAYVTVRDLEREEDLDVVVIGNSEATRHFDPYLFEELTGKNSYNFSRFSSTVATQYTMMEQMFRTHQPEKVLVFFDAYTLVKLDPDTLEHREESAFVQASIWPYLRDPVDRIGYVLSLASADQAYLDRFFPWRLHMPRTPGGVITNVRNKVDDLLGNGHYYDTARASLSNETSTYAGKGFAPLHEDQVTTSEAISNFCTFTYAKQEIQIPEDTKEWIRKMDELCRDNDCQLIAVNIPLLPEVAISRMLNIYDAQSCLFAELEIPYWNLNYAKADAVQQMDVSYYYDASHMTWAGAEIFTEALADVFNADRRGEDVSLMFHTTDGYLAAIDYVTNTWLTEESRAEQTELTAYANHGTDVVPEYRFVKMGTDGGEIVLQDYSAENTCLVKLEDGEKVCLYTRNASAPEQQPLRFVLE